MINKITKHILLDVNESTQALLDSVFLKLNVEISHSITEGENYGFIFTQNLDFGAIKDSQIIYITDEAPKQSLCYLSESSLGNKIVQLSIKRMLGDNSNMSEDKEFVPVEAKSFKITSKNSFGFYLDYILTMALKFEFDTDLITSDYIKICLELILREEKIPLNLDLFANQESFIMQLSYDSLDMDFGLVVDNIQDVNASLFDCYKLTESRVSALGCYYVKELEGRSRLIQSCEIPQGFDNKVYRSFSELGDYKKEELTSAKAKTSSLATIKKIVNFLAGIADFQKIEFSELLSQYPERMIVKGLSQEDKDFIKKVLGDKNLLETMNISIKGHEEELCEAENLPSKIARALQGIDVFDIKSILGEEEFITRISGVTQDLSEDSQLVSGRVDEDESFQKIQGTREDLTEDITRIAGSGDDTSKGKWELKRLGLGEKLEEQITRLVSTEGFTKEELSQRIEDVIGEVLGTDDNKVKSKIKDAILESAAIEDLSLKISNETSSENIFLQLENDRYRGQIARKNDQLLRMKKVMDTMKGEFLARKKAEGELGDKIQNATSISSEQKLESASLQLDALMRENRIKETRIEQLEKANAHTIKNKDQRIIQLEERIADLVSSPSADGEDLGIKVSELEHINKQFENQLSIAESRIQTLSKKLDTELKNKIQISSTGAELAKILDSERRQNSLQAKKIEELETKISSVKDSDDLQDNKDKTKELETTLRETQLENKKLEQKMKFLASQMTELDKKLKRATGTSTSASGASISDKKIKQLESAMEKITALKSKAEDELLKKKEEAHKLKQENNSMQRKLEELERKLSKFDKKAA